MSPFFAAAFPPLTAKSAKIAELHLQNLQHIAQAVNSMGAEHDEFAAHFDHRSAHAQGK